MCLIPAVQHAHTSGLLSFMPQCLHFHISFSITFKLYNRDSAYTLSNIPNGGYVCSCILYISNIGGLSESNTIYSSFHAAQLMVGGGEFIFIQTWHFHHSHKINPHVWTMLLRCRLHGAPDKQPCKNVNMSPAWADITGGTGSGSPLPGKNLSWPPQYINTTV